MNDLKLAETLELRLNTKGLLEYYSKSGQTYQVTPVRCFPWSSLNGYISLRDDQERELTLIKNIDELSEASKLALLQYLKQVDFIFEINQIFSIVTEFEIRNWKVQTKQGKFSFQTKLDSWPHTLNNDEIIIKDICGNLFKIPCLNDLDKASQKILWPYIG